jgi:homogentisate 1,2-dioxygenase
MKTWIHIPKTEGLSSKQAHADLPQGTYERELGKSGFFGPATHMYHTHAPTAWIDWEGPLRPRAFDLSKLSISSLSPWHASSFMRNAHINVRWWIIDISMDHLVRNADGDDLLFIHEGEADLFCDYGHIHLQEGDYFMIPRGTQWRLEVVSLLKILLIEATNDSYFLPDKGIAGPHAIFDPAALEVPQMDEAFKHQQTAYNHPWKVVIKRQDVLSTVTFGFNPLDAVGWHGNLMPVKINWRDIRPLMSHRYHLPPSAHTTFLSSRFVVCTFCPRPIESDPGALKVPFYHNNDDYDEFLFYHRGEFFSRDNIHPGMVTIHPCGFPHGPHPGAFSIGAKAERKETNEVAVMIDTRDPLDILPIVEDIEWKEYIHSWKGIEKP